MKQKCLNNYEFYISSYIFKSYTSLFSKQGSSKIYGCDNIVKKLKINTSKMAENFLWCVKTLIHRSFHYQKIKLNVYFSVYKD